MAKVASFDESMVAFATSLEEVTVSVVIAVAVRTASFAVDDVVDPTCWSDVVASAAVVDDVVVLAVATAAAPPIDASAFVTLVTTLAIAVTMAWANAETFCTA